MKTNTKTAIVSNVMRPVFRKDNDRLGKEDDGGYIVPTEICRSAKRLVSMGINLDWSFEVAFLKLNPACQIHCYDKSTSFGRAVYWGLSRFAYSPISRRKSHLLAFMTPFRYAFFSNKQVELVQKFVGPKSEEGVISIDEVMAVCQEPHSTFLKIDIEGSEYDILDQLLLHEGKISAIAIEFHHVLNEPKFESLIDKLLKHFAITHIHVNNAGGLDEQQRPHLLEITFVHRALVGDAPLESDVTYRHPQDRPNVPYLDDVIITFNEEKLQTEPT